MMLVGPTVRGDLPLLRGGLRGAMQQHLRQTGKLKENEARGYFLVGRCFAFPLREGIGLEKGRRRRKKVPKFSEVRKAYDLGGRSCG